MIGQYRIAVVVNRHAERQAREVSQSKLAQDPRDARVQRQTPLAIRVAAPRPRYVLQVTPQSRLMVS